jgi:hypothetical protein
MKARKSPHVSRRGCDPTSIGTGIAIAGGLALPLSGDANMINGWYSGGGALKVLTPYAPTCPTGYMPITWKPARLARTPRSQRRHRSPRRSGYSGGHRSERSRARSEPSLR